MNTNRTAYRLSLLIEPPMNRGESVAVNMLFDAEEWWPLFTD